MNFLDELFLGFFFELLILAIVGTVTFIVKGLLNRYTKEQSDDRYVRKDE